MVDVTKVKEVRNRSGAGMSDCKLALEESGNDVDQALIILQKKGILRASARASRIATEGLVHSYVHNGRVGVLVEVNAETDFVSRSPDFTQFVEEVALQIAAMSPQWTSADEVPKATVDSQVEIFTEQLRAEGKPEKAWAKIAAGKLQKWYGEMCLEEQESVVHPDIRIGQLRIALSSKTGENIRIRRFIRWELGEGLAREKTDFVAEVNKLAE